MSNQIVLTSEQLSELREMAKEIMIDRGWDKLPWEAAWEGVYPDPPSELEIEAEFQILKSKLIRIISKRPLIDEYSNFVEHGRMIYLESAKSFNLYRFSNGS